MSATSNVFPFRSVSPVHIRFPKRKAYMTIQKDRVVSIDYELKDASGALIDRSEGEPLVYLHGNDNIIPGLERQLEGKNIGDAVKCVIAPTEGYGERDDELVFDVAKSNFAEPEKISLGMQFQAQQEDGTHIVTVVSMDGDNVKVDANHPLAGKDLHFSVTVKDVREASEEELSHGHVHGDQECGDDCECGDSEGSSGCSCGGCN